ncbi:16S rRNA (guanine(966)-N(2))-methyltransferase RsmD [Thiomicrospira sp. WB1]|uniref:16S rRNA (guanine(966)-N(2))-methyltransferase RsmD n=1 Tax=Thiomicrospira sp. WB1 TaxID=1685380 RepID=UPI00074ADC08|nr:16S rRNA (guanine(966)-N(2))-methyltransferase RsmD [Thiomicrospira sp. WB1]KUJ71309.1 16S rRNA (guanine(966)-N(2))-methyltransferase RsmD [Thiomicrospira sp. WB1]
MTQRRRSKRRTTPRRTPGHQAGGQIRLIGGDWRGHKLPVLSADGLRPTSDRVRETLFNWLQFELPGSQLLDAFAGTGALGLEALSRGAQSVTLVEAFAPAAAQLQANLARLPGASERATVLQRSVLDWLASSRPNDRAPFDGVFLDPPFEQGLMQPTLNALFQNNWLSDQAWLYLEQEKHLDWPVLLQGWALVKEKTTSQVRFGLVKKDV